MPGPALAPLFMPGAMATAKHMAFHAAAYVDVGTLTSTTFVALLAHQLLWKRLIPDWVKEDISFRMLLLKKGTTTGNHNSSDPGDLSNLGSVVEKLQDLLNGTSRMPVDRVPQIHAALLAYIQLSSQLRKQHHKQQQPKLPFVPSPPIEGTQQEQQQEEAEAGSLSKREERQEESRPNLPTVESTEESPSLSTADDRDDGCDDSDVDYDYGCARDELYASAGPPMPLDEVRSNKAIQQALTFATWAYYDDTEILTTKLEEEDYSLVMHHQSARPGHVAYFMAACPAKKQVVVGIRGTSTIEELLTDCCGSAVPWKETDDDDTMFIEVEASQPNTVLVASERVETDNDDEVGIIHGHVVAAAEEIEIISGHERIICQDHDMLEGDNIIRCHEGIMISTRKMVHHIDAWIQAWVIHGGYNLVLCGHSLGAGAAILAGLMLRNKYPILADQQQQRKSLTGTKTPIGTEPETKRLEVFALAPPPVLDHDSAIAAASFCTTIVHNADIIPRCSLSNLTVFMECLRGVHHRLESQGMNPTGIESTAKFIHHLTQGSSEEEKLLMNATEFHQAFQDAHDRIQLRRPHHLFIPGKVLLIYEPWIQDGDHDNDDNEENNGGNDANNVSHDSQESGSAKEKTPFIATTTNKMQCVVTDGTAPVFQTLEVDSPKLFTDHVTSSYFQALGMEYQF